MSFNHWIIVTGIVFGSQILLPDQSLADDSGPVMLGAIGDSITRGFSSGGALDNPRNSWSTGNGNQVNSHKKRLEKELGRSVVTDNSAKSGAVAGDLDQQVTNLLTSSPDYVTLLIGANDICAWQDSFQDARDKFFQNVVGALTRLIAANSSVKIVLAPIPDMYNLWETGVQNGCQTTWDVVRFCRALLASNRSDLDRQHFVEKWVSANDALAAAADQFPDNVKFIVEVQNLQFELDDISRIDCFHPSVKGQNLLSEETWKYGWFQ